MLTVEHAERQRLARISKRREAVIARRVDDFCNKIGQKLIDFVTNECSANIKVVRHPDEAAKIGLVPETASVPSDLRTLFEPLGEQIPVYPSEFWRAFLVPAPFGLKKFVKKGGDHEIVQQSSTPEPESDWVEIQNTYIRTENEGILPKSKVWERIKNWAIANGLVESDFRGAHGAHAPRELTVLEVLLKHIDDKDLHRVSIPFDLIAKMAKTKSSTK